MNEWLKSLNFFPKNSILDISHRLKYTSANNLKQSSGTYIETTLSVKFNVKLKMKFSVKKPFVSLYLPQEIENKTPSSRCEALKSHNCHFIIMPTRKRHLDISKLVS